MPIAWQWRGHVVAYWLCIVITKLAHKPNGFASALTQGSLSNNNPHAWCVRLRTTSRAESYAGETYANAAPMHLHREVCARAQSFRSDDDGDDDADDHHVLSSWSSTF